ncbi:MAG: magnesium transporter CorA family protein [Azospirillaceae bacterium]
MITAYARAGGRIVATPLATGESVPAGAAWIDLFQPDPAELAAVGATLGHPLPGTAERREIEASSRFVADPPLLTMTVPILADAESDRPVLDGVTFALTPDALVTLRHHEPRPLKSVEALAERGERVALDPLETLIALLEAIVDRAADILEVVAGRLDGASRTLFPDPSATGPRRRPDRAATLSSLGRAGELIGQLRDSLGWIGRMIGFLTASGPTMSADQRQRLKTATRDVRSITDYADYQTQRTAMLLDAALGLIGADANNLTKGFTIAATAFLPPTLIASIYGMNFEVMPELGRVWGYPAALAAMVLSAAVPLWYFRRRGWI